MSTAEALPSQIAHFEVLGKLGQGAFGTVYRVREPNSGQVLALKWIAEMDPKDRLQWLRFEREVEIASALSHPNLVKVHEWGKWRGAPWCTMSVIEGPTLKEVLAQPLSPERVHQLGTPLFSALQHLHNHRVVHRDIKPENIFVAGGHTPILGDFGLALRQSTHLRSQAGTVTGTFAYMAPEVLRCKEPTRRSDMFSLGVVLLEMICGRLPYPTEDTRAILSRLMGPGPLALDEMLPDAPDELVHVLRRLVAMAPEDRYFTIAQAYYDWIEALGVWLGRLPQAAALEVEVASYSLLTSGFTGREAALEALDRARERALSDGPQGVLLEGAHGLGKSCTLSHWCRQQGDSLFRATFARPDDPPYTGLIELFQQAIAAYPGHKRSSKSHPAVDLMLVANLVQQARQGFARYTPGFHGVPDSLNRALEGNSDVDLMRLHEAMRGLLSAVAHHRQRLIVVMEDVQRADPASLRFLRYLLERWGDQAGAHTPILVVASFCPENTRPLASLPRLERVLLERLTGEEQEAMVRSLLGVGEQELPAELMPKLESQARGHPQALQEVLNAFIHSGVLRLQRDHWQWSAPAYKAWRGDLAEQAVDTLAALTEEELKVLAALASASQAVALEELLVVLPARSERELYETLHDLKEGGFVFQDEARYRVAHRRLEQTLLDQLSPPERERLHAAWASHLEQRLQSESASTELVVALVHHREALGQLETVAEFLLQLAERAAEIHAYAQAVQTYRRVLANAAARFSTEELRALRLRLIDLEALAGLHGDALAHLEELLKTCVRPAERLQILRLTARAHFDRGDQTRATQVWESILREQGLKTPGPGWNGTLRALLSWARAERAGWEEPRLLRHMQEVDVLAEAFYGIIKGEYVRSNPRRRNLLLYVTMAMRQMANVTRRDDLLANAHALTAAFYTLHFYSERRRRSDCRLAVQHARACGQPRVLSEILWIIGYVEIQAGNLDEAHRLASEAAEVARRANDIPGLGYANNILSLGAVFCGDLALADACLDESVPAARAMRHPRLTLGLRNIEIWRDLVAGDWAAASRHCQPYECEQFVELDSTVLLMMEGILAFRKGQLVAAQGLLQEAQAEFRRLKSGWMHSLHAAFWLGQTLAEHLRQHPYSAAAKQRRRLLGQLAGAEPRGYLKAYSKPLRAEVAALDGRPADGLQLYDQAVDIAIKSNLRPQAAWNLEFGAALAERFGLDGGRQRLERAIELCQDMNCPLQVARLRLL